MKPEIPWLFDPKSQETSKRLGKLENCKKLNKGTIGIAGHYPIENSKLAVQMVASGSKRGYKDDQDHPELIVMNLSSTDKSYPYLRDQVKILTDYGCDVIVIPEFDVTEQQKESLKTETKGRAAIVFQHQSESYEELSDRALSEVEKSPPIRPDIYDSSEYDVILQNVEQDINEREARIKSRIEDGGYPKLFSRVGLNQNIVGVLGGAGPMASAQYSLELAQQGVPHIHLSNNSAPYKINYALGVGHSFLSHYKNSVAAMKSIVRDIGERSLSVAAPCNTMHLFLDVLKECPEFKDVNFIDIRESVKLDIEENNRTKKILLLGTDATVGIDAEGKYIDGLYDKVFHDVNRIPIKPNREQQNRVNDAINLSKEGKMEEAREKIKNVISDINSKYGRNIDVALVCTDLPIAFGPNTLSEIGAISTVQTLATLTKKVVSKLSASPKPSAKIRGTRRKRLTDTEDSYDKQPSSGSDNSEELTPDYKKRREEFSSSGNEDEEVSEMSVSDSEEIRDVDFSKYRISYNFNNSQRAYRIYFNDPDGSKVSQVERIQDMKLFCHKYSKRSNNAIHSKYITFRDKNSFPKLNEFIRERGIPEEQREDTHDR